MNRLWTAAVFALCTLAPQAAHAFCGFYVGKAGAELYNHASQVVIVRDGHRTVLTMSNDFQGNMKDFALVVPVPVVLKKEQVHVGERRLVERIDNYSAPRLVEYFDSNPCNPPPPPEMVYAPAPAGAAMMDTNAPKEPPKPKVRIEAQYTVGEYDIVILSADESNALETWLKQNGYQIPPRAAAALEPYIKTMKFFVAKVNLKEQEKTGTKFLRPIQMAYESEKFMLPIRLGMANSKGEQDLLVYTLTKNGRVEVTNYKTDKVPSDQNVPIFVKDDFKSFYPALFEQTHRKTNYRAVHTEYVWRSVGCDPCADDPLAYEELRGLGVWWINQNNYYNEVPLVTRLHVRYDAEHFPEDLMFQETGDQQNFQARYILQHKATGDLSCPAGQEYLRQLDKRHEQEAKTLVELTGWKHDDIVKKMGDDAPGKVGKGGDSSWYKDLWK